MLQIVLVVIVLTFPSVVSLVAVVAGGWWLVALLPWLGGN
jgi:hypothetical protein